MTIEFKKEFSVRYPGGWEVKATFSCNDWATRKVAEEYIDDNGVSPLDFYELMLNELHKNKCKHCIEYIWN
jgi:hypothetical protein